MRAEREKERETESARARERDGKRETQTEQYQHTRNYIFQGLNLTLYQKFIVFNLHIYSMEYPGGAGERLRRGCCLF